MIRVRRMEDLHVLEEQEPVEDAGLVDARDVFLQLDFYWNQLFDGRGGEKEAGERKIAMVMVVMVESGNGIHRGEKKS